MFTPPSDQTITNIMKKFADKNKERTGVEMTVSTDLFSSKRLYFLFLCVKRFDLSIL
jgi:hypothetical protein